MTMKRWSPRTASWFETDLPLGFDHPADVALFVEADRVWAPSFHAFQVGELLFKGRLDEAFAWKRGT
jgi:hypothetical protein